MALVNCYKTAEAESSTASSRTTSHQQLGQSSSGIARPKSNRKSSGMQELGEDVDLQRALDLVELHDRVKENQASRVDQPLERARKDVQQVWEGLQNVKT